MPRGVLEIAINRPRCFENGRPRGKIFTWQRPVERQSICSSFTIFREIRIRQTATVQTESPKQRTAPVRVPFKVTATFAAIAAFGVLASPPAPADTINVLLDRAQVVRLPDKVQTLVIGNPSVADASLQGGGLLVITGKGYGTTNIIALDSRGEVLSEHTVLVGAPRESSLTVWRGAKRETWSCAPRCEQSVMLGDTPEFFNGTIEQIGARNGHATGAAAKKDE
jgi:hypothetical protein